MIWNKFFQKIFIPIGDFVAAETCARDKLTHSVLGKELLHTNWLLFFTGCGGVVSAIKADKVPSSYPSDFSFKSF